MQKKLSFKYFDFITTFKNEKQNKIFVKALLNNLILYDNSQVSKVFS